MHCCVCCVELVKARSVLWSTDHTLGWAGDAVIGFVYFEVACRTYNMKFDKCKQTGRDKAIQVDYCKICQECVDAVAFVNV